jgi:hypothetical protein
LASVENKKRNTSDLGGPRLPDSGAKMSKMSPVATVKKRTKSAAKEYGPHEHFGSPLNICRICGQKYSYAPKPLDPFRESKN